MPLLRDDTRPVAPVTHLKLPMSTRTVWFEALPGREVLALRVSHLTKKWGQPSRAGARLHKQH